MKGKGITPPATVVAYVCHIPGCGRATIPGLPVCPSCRLSYLNGVTDGARGTKRDATLCGGCGHFIHPGTPCGWHGGSCKEAQADPERWCQCPERSNSSSEPGKGGVESQRRVPSRMAGAHPASTDAGGPAPTAPERPPKGSEEDPASKMCRCHHPLSSHEREGDEDAEWLHCLNAGCWCRDFRPAREDT